MGTAIKKLLEPKEISLEDLTNKTLAVDAFNTLYQFVTTIRMADGTPLKNSKGQVTSHMVGLFNRVLTLLKGRIKLIFVFDGESPDLKKVEQDRRRQLKVEAEKKHEEAAQNEDTEAMAKYAARSAKLTPEMVEQSKKLLDAMGVPWVQAPAEAEAQAALLVRNNDADYVASQDLDCLLFGAPQTVRYASVSGRRRRPNTRTYDSINPEVISLQEVLTTLEINQDQLIAIGMLTGTDFATGGVHGYGPKKSLKLAKEAQSINEIFETAQWDQHNDVSWEVVFDLIKNMPVTEDYQITFKKINQQQLTKLLVDECEFSEERINKQLSALAKSKKQKGLADYF